MNWPFLLPLSLRYLDGHSLRCSGNFYTNTNDFGIIHIITKKLIFLTLLFRLPIAVEMLIHKRDWIKFIKWVIISAVVIVIPMVWVDSLYFGKLVIAPLNIILYNVFTNHGPNLYGTEPFSYYIINGFLNFNFVFIGALFAPLGLVRILIIYTQSIQNVSNIARFLWTTDSSNLNNSLPTWKFEFC